MSSIIEEYDSMFNALERWAKSRSVVVSDDSLLVASATLMVYDIERRGWLNRSEELQRAQRIAQAAKDAITKELS